MNSASECCIIENNILLAAGTTKSWGIYENSFGLLSKLNNNDFFSCALAYVYSGGSYTIAEIDDLEAALGAKADENVSEDPKFVDHSNGDWHLTGTDAGQNVSRGGRNLSGFEEDKDGRIRTDPWSIGSYEKD